MRDYGKVYSSIWASPSFRALSEDGRTLCLYLLTSPHGTISGCFRLPDGYACEDLQWSAERVAEGFRELFDNGFANRCGTTNWVWVRKFLEWNPPENPNQRKAAAKQASQVPDQCAWKPDFMRVCGPLLGLEVPAEAEPLANPSGTVPKPGTVAVAVAEELSLLTQAPALPPEDRPPQAGPLTLVEAPKPKAPGLPDCPHQAVLALWAEVLPAMPQHLQSQWRGSRADHLRARWRETAAEKGWTTEAEGLAYLRKLFGYVGQSAFLTGRASPRDPNKRPFVIELEWLVNPTNWAKVIEGKYHTEAA